jgi:hypothetical protein
MKKFIIVLCLFGISVTAFAQEEKPTIDKPASPELTALQTAASLARYGYANYSATALIEAAKIFSETKVQDLGMKGVPADPQAVSEKDNKLVLDPAQLLADAKKFAGKDKVVLAYAKQVEKGLKTGSTRGVVGGPKYGEGRVYGKSYTDYQAKFWANELAEVIMVGDGDNDLDMYVYDERGNLIASDTDYTDQCVCRWVPAWTGTFTIRIVNRGAVYSDFAIATN